MIKSSQTAGEDAKPQVGLFAPKDSLLSCFQMTLPSFSSKRTMARGSETRVGIDSSKYMIERAIKKGAGELDGINYEEILYEGYGPGGIAIIMNILTDNRNRTVAEIRHLMNKYGGNLGEAGSVSWMFKHKGQIIIDATNINENTLIENVIDLEIEDLKTQKLEFTIFTKPSDLFQIVDQIEKKGYSIKSSTLEYIAKSYVKIEGSMVDKAITLI